MLLTACSVRMEECHKTAVGYSGFLELQSRWSCGTFRPTRVSRGALCVCAHQAKLEHVCQKVISLDSGDRRAVPFLRGLLNHPRCLKFASHFNLYASASSCPTLSSRLKSTLVPGMSSHEGIYTW